MSKPPKVTRSFCASCSLPWWPLAALLLAAACSSSSESSDGSAQRGDTSLGDLDRDRGPATDGDDPGRQDQSSEDPCGPPVDEAAWTIQTVAGQCSYNAIAVDSAGRAHITFVSGSNAAGTAKLSYATDSGGSWGVEVIDADAERVRRTGIRLDSNDVIHIVYGRIVGKTVRYATNPEGTWQIESAGGGALGGSTPAIALDSAGIPHVSYHGNDYMGDLYHAVRDEGGWTRKMIDSAGGTNSSLGVADDGVVHIAYHPSSSSGAAKHARRGTDGTWTTGELAAAAASSLAVDRQGQPRVVLALADKIALAGRSGDSWDTSEVIHPLPTDKKAAGVAIAIHRGTEADTIHVAFVIDGCGLYHAERAETDADWTVARVDPLAGAAQLAVQPKAGTVHLSYCGSGNKLIHATPAAP